MTQIVTQEQRMALVAVLESSLYPGAAHQSIEMVLGYCEAAQLDVMLKPVHIVPMWDGKAKRMRDVVMPGIGLYRIQAARSGQYAGVSDPEFGEDVTAKVGSRELTYPKYCKVTVRRKMADGSVAEFSAVELWLENYATAGKKDGQIDHSPNSMWARRPYAQLAKCAEAQALRKAFPEVGAQPTAEEMDGKRVDDDEFNDAHPSPVQTPTEPTKSLPAITGEAWAKAIATCTKGFRSGKSLDDALGFYQARHTLSDAQIAEVKQLHTKNAPIDMATGEVQAAAAVAPTQQGMSFAQVADAIAKANDTDALDMARGFIEAVQDPELQAELHQKAAQRLAQITQSA